MRLIKKALPMILLSLLISGCGGSGSISYEKISAKEAKEKMTDEQVFIVDVRSPQEFQEGHIQNAVNIPLDQIEEIVDQASKDEIILVYCRSGNRSAQAAQKLVELEYEHVFDFGGISDWSYEIVK